MQGGGIKIFGVDICINGVTTRNEDDGGGSGGGDNSTMQTEVQVVTVSRVQMSHTTHNNHHDHVPNHDHNMVNNNINPKPPRKRERSVSSSASTTTATTSTSTNLAKNKPNTNRRSWPSKEKTCRANRTRPMVLPPAIQQKIRKLEVDVNDEKSEPKLILQKLVYKSDVDNQQARFLIPKGQLIRSEDEFLEHNEWKALNEGEGKIKVKVIQETMEIEDREMNLARWPKPKKPGEISTKPNRSYALQSEWNEVKKESKIKKHDVVQVWAFRYGKEKKLGLALVDLGPVDEYEDRYANSRN